jgi:hypothetical protein
VDSCGHTKDSYLHSEIIGNFVAGENKRRVLVLQEGWKKKTSTTFLEAIPTIEREGTGTGTLWFGPKYPVVAAKGRKTRNMSRFSIGDVPVFADIGEVDSVYRLTMDLREKEARGSISEPGLTYVTD